MNLWNKQIAHLASAGYNKLHKEQAEPPKEVVKRGKTNKRKSSRST